MKIVQLTPGAGGMYCGNCVHDNALVAALRRLGHDAVMLPLYLPLRLDETDQSAGQPVFFGGINVYLEQKSALYRRAPRWVRRLLNSRRLLALAAGRAAKTRPDQVGDLLLSMLRGEHGHQNRTLTELIEWLRQHARPDVVCLSNALLVGMARRIRHELAVPVVCLLQGEEPYLEALPTAYRESAWALMTERAADVRAWIAPSRWAANRMAARLGLDQARVHVAHDGINLEGFAGPAAAAAGRTGQPAGRDAARVLGFFARMCPEKGLDTLVEAFIALKRRGRVPRLKLHVGGSCGPGDEPFVRQLRQRLAEAGFVGEVMFAPNPTRAEKLAFLSALSVFSVPALYGEAFGLYLLEAMAAGVPVVQPAHGAFPEIVAATGGGLLYKPTGPESLAEAVEQLLLDPVRARALGAAGQRAVFEKFSADAMARATLEVFQTAVAAGAA